MPDAHTRAPLRAVLSWALPLVTVIVVAIAVAVRVEGELHAESRAAMVQEHAAKSGGGQEHGAQTGDSEEHPVDGQTIFNSLFSHVTPHVFAVIDLGDTKVTIYDITIWQLIAVVLIFFLFMHVRRSLERAADGRPQGWIARVFSGFVMFIRDEMVMPLMGEKDGKAFLPYFLFVFFFIAFMNLLGLVPHSKTPTASIVVTGAMAFVTFVMMIGGGMKEQGAAVFWKNLIPHGVPKPLLVIMVPVELIGLVVKPFALMIRLFANMLAGHLVVLSFMGLILLFGAQIKGWAYAIAVPSVGLAVFIMIIEGFVALLQAYIFTYLSILFISMCRHPDH